MVPATQVRVLRLSPFIGANNCFRKALMAFGTADGKKRRNTMTATISIPNTATMPIAAKRFSMGWAIERPIVQPRMPNAIRETANQVSALGTSTPLVHPLEGMTLVSGARDKALDSDATGMATSGRFALPAVSNPGGFGKWLSRRLAHSDAD